MALRHFCRVCLYYAVLCAVVHGVTSARLPRDLLSNDHRCLCIFDFDNTLRITVNGNGWTPASDASGIIQQCKDRGYGIAIASANADRQFLSWFLSGKVNGDVFNSDFLNSAAFQTGYGDKSIELNAILKYYNAAGQCAMFFDDSWYNRQYADETGVMFQQVDGSKGVTWSDYQMASSKLPGQCGCP